MPEAGNPVRVGEGGAGCPHSFPFPKVAAAVLRSPGAAVRHGDCRSEQPEAPEQVCLGSLTDVAEARPNISSDRKPTLPRPPTGRKGPIPAARAAIKITGSWPPGQMQPVAISNRRLVAADDGSVSFRRKDYRIEGPGRWKTMAIAPHEFIRRS